MRNPLITPCCRMSCTDNMSSELKHSRPHIRMQQVMELYTGNDGFKTALGATACCITVLGATL